ncbi:MAG: TIGR00730 family Rossman fold protein [Betaproteobacteria bacterium]|nr:TIGR00730 family Rossman fold protein [Betaproteobacteria bacterium]
MRWPRTSPRETDAGHPVRRICVFCGSNVGSRPSYAAAARELAMELGRRQLGLVYGGGHAGLMGILADAALANGVVVTGVITEQLQILERGHSGLTESRTVGTMHERKAVMANMSDGFIALPGGFGTFEELCEMITWTQLRVHAKPVVLINVEGFFDPLLAQFDRAVEDKLLRPENRKEVIAVATPAEALDQVATWAPHESGKWFEPPQP